MRLDADTASIRYYKSYISDLRKLLQILSVTADSQL